MSSRITSTRLGRSLCYSTALMVCSSLQIFRHLILSKPS